MTSALIKKLISQSAILWSGCALALFAFCWVRVWVVSLLDMGKFRTVLEQFREFERFAPIGFDQLFTYTGRIAMTFDEPVVVFCIVVWAISRGSDSVSGELNRGTLEMLLSQPISRTRYLVTHSLVSTVGLGLLTVCIWAGIWIGVQLTSVEETVPPPALTIPWVKLSFPLSASAPEKVVVLMRDEVACSIFVPSCINIFAFGLFVLALSTLFSAIDRYRWRTVGIVIAVYVLQLVIYGLGKAAESLNWLMHFSFFDLYRPQPIAQAVQDHGWASVLSLTTVTDEGMLGPLAYTLLLLLLASVLFGAALKIFQQRDLPAPL